MSVHPIVLWQQEFRAQPQVWTVSVRFDGSTEDTGNLYDSREAAELEASWLRAHGYKSAKVRSAGNIHNMKLSEERWGKLGKEPPVIVSAPLKAGGK